MTSLDYYAIEELLTDDERAARDRTWRFVQEEVMPEVVACHRAAKFPDKVRPRMGALRLFAPYLKEHGCAGLSYTAYGLIMQELERADSGLRSEASVQGALAIYAIHSFGSPEQHARWILKGSLVFVCRARGNAGLRTAGSQRRIACPKLPDYARRCRVLRKRAWAWRGA